MVWGRHSAIQLSLLPKAGSRSQSLSCWRRAIVFTHICFRDCQHAAYLLAVQAELAWRWPSIAILNLFGVFSFSLDFQFLSANS